VFGIKTVGVLLCESEFITKTWKMKSRLN